MFCVLKYKTIFLVCVLKHHVGFQNTKTKHYAWQPPFGNVFVFWNRDPVFVNVPWKNSQYFKTQTDIMSLHICVLKPTFVTGITKLNTAFVFWNPVLGYKIQRHNGIGTLEPLRYVFAFWNPCLYFHILLCVLNLVSDSFFVFWNPTLYFQI